MKAHSQDCRVFPCACVWNKQQLFKCSQCVKFLNINPMKRGERSRYKGQTRNLAKRQQICLCSKSKDRISMASANFANYLAP